MKNNNNMKKINYRHGDVLLHEIKELPANLKELKHDGNFVLAYGAVTGHKHLIISSDMKIYEDDNGRYYIKLDNNAELKHEEHKTIVIEPRIYEINFEQEKDWFSNSVRQVID